MMFGSKPFTAMGQGWHGSCFEIEAGWMTGMLATFDNGAKLA
jgi:hypothetical protein